MEPPIIYPEASKELADWRTYKANPEAIDGQHSLERLLSRHEPLLRRIARNVAWKHSSMDFEDARQDARLLAIESYHSFDPNKNCALRTWVWFKVTRRIAEVDQEQSLVRCPSRMAPVHNYILGKFDSSPERSQALAASFGFQSVEHARKLFAALAPILSVDSNPSFAWEEERSSYWEKHLADRNAPTETQILDRLALEEAFEHLTADQQQALLYMIDGEMSHQEICERMGQSIAKLRSDLLLGRRQLRRNFNQ